MTLELLVFLLQPVQWLTGIVFPPIDDWNLFFFDKKRVITLLPRWLKLLLNVINVRCVLILQRFDLRLLLGQGLFKTVN